MPVDPRLEEYYYLAGQYFAEQIKPNLLVPIHFSNNYSVTAKFADKIADLPIKAAKIEKRGEQISYKANT